METIREYTVKAYLFIEEARQNVTLLREAIERYKKDNMLSDLIMASNYLNSIFSITEVLDKMLPVKSSRFLDIITVNRAYEIVSPKLDEIKKSKCKY